MTNKQMHFFNIAKEISHLGNFKRAKIGAVVVEKNRIISTGYNSLKTSPIQRKYNRFRNFEKNLNDCNHTLHAEIMALSPLLKKTIDWKHVDIYVYRELSDGTRTCAKPCAGCTALIHELGIRNIYYTDWNGEYIKETPL